MKKTLLTLLACTAITPAVWADNFNQNITAIFGSGNPDSGWVTDTGSGITLGLRGKNRTTGATPNDGAGTFSFATGTAPASSKALWNYEFSLNAGTALLSSYDFYLRADQDPSQGISYLTVNALTGFNDDSYGNSGTANGAGTNGTSALAISNSIAQNSENILFTGLNPNLNATYNYDLFAVAKGSGLDGRRLADVGITVVVGQGGSRVPDATSTSLLLVTGLVGIAGLARRRRTA